MKGVYTANQPLALGGQIYMWNRYAQCEWLVHMTTAQFTKFGHQSRIQLADKHGALSMFVIELRDRSFKPLNEVMLVNPKKTLKLLRATLQALYGRAPYYQQVMECVNTAYAPVDRQPTPEVSLSEFNCGLTDELLKYVDLPVLTVEDHRVLNIRPEDPSEWVASMGRVFKCSKYVGGGTAKDAYIKAEHWQDLEYVVQDWKPSSYRRTSKNSMDNPQVSIIDLLMYAPAEDARAYVQT